MLQFDGFLKYIDDTDVSMVRSFFSLTGVSSTHLEDFDHMDALITSPVGEVSVVACTCRCVSNN